MCTGGWTQIATEAVGEDGLVIGVDSATAPVEGTPHGRRYQR